MIDTEFIWLCVMVYLLSVMRIAVCFRRLLLRMLSRLAR